MLVKVTKEEGFLTFISTVIALETLYIYRQAELWFLQSKHRATVHGWGEFINSKGRFWVGLKEQG